MTLQTLSPNPLREAGVIPGGSIKSSRRKKGVRSPPRTRPKPDAILDVLPTGHWALTRTPLGWMAVEVSA